MPLPILTIDGGPEDGQSFTIADQTTTLGREEDNDVVVRGPGVSRMHATIVQEAGEYFLRDSGSTNGTFINDRKIGNVEHPLRHGDQIRMGPSQVSLVFRYDERITVRVAVPARGVDRRSIGRHAVDRMTPTEKVLEFLSIHPEGAGYETLSQVAGMTEKQIVLVIARLVEDDRVRQERLHFFAVPQVPEARDKPPTEFVRG